MKVLKMILALCFVGLIAACTETTVYDNTGPVASNGTGTTYGGFDGAGGNTIDGRPIESFKVPIIDYYPEFSSMILPLLKKIATKDPVFGGELIHIMLQRNWIALPTPLNKLSAQQIGAYVGDGTLGQFALQSLKEIWLDDKQIQAMPTAEDRRFALFHELIIGVRLLQFSDNRDSCQARAAITNLPRVGLDDDVSRQNQYDANIKQCAKKGAIFGNVTIGSPIDPTLKLTDADYVRTRDVTTKIISQIDSLSGEDLHNLRSIDLLRGREFDDLRAPELISSAEPKTQSSPGTDSETPPPPTAPLDL